MTDLLAPILDAHGGLARWRSFEKVEANIVTGGALWGLKGLVQDPEPRRMTIWLHEQRASVTPFGAPDQLTDFTPDRIAIQKIDGTIVALRNDPRASFAGHGLTSPWDPLHRAYFNGYALWIYFTTPFLLARPDVQVTEMNPWQEGEESWRVLRAVFPDTIATHSAVQHFYFDSAYMLRRHDYHVDVAGGFAAAQLVYDYVEADGLKMPSIRRAYTRDAECRPNLEPLMVAIDISGIRYS